MMLTRMIDPAAEQVIIVAEGHGDRRKAASLELSYRILATGEAVAGIGDELDIATADTAVRYVTGVIERHHGPVIVDLTALRFCDARGLSALLQIALYAEQRDHQFRVASPSPSLVRLLRITALDRKLLGATGPGGADHVRSERPRPIALLGAQRRGGADARGPSCRQQRAPRGDHHAGRRQRDHLPTGVDVQVAGGQADVRG
jgi:anti-anti-sigma factor